MASMVVHDKRLSGQTPLHYSFVFQVDENRPIREIVNVVARRARERRRLRVLHILCHGFEETWNLSQQMCMPAAHGGFGLQLGAEGLDLFNVGLTRAWSGLIDLIVLFACAPADTAVYNRGTWGDGRRFVGELALHSGARVIAARDTQYYNPSGVIDFGGWEGPVLEFSPANPEGVRVSNPNRYRVHRTAQDAR
jgi:hypothetical protein